MGAQRCQVVSTNDPKNTPPLPAPPALAPPQLAHDQGTPQAHKLGSGTCSFLTQSLSASHFMEPLQKH